MPIYLKYDTIAGGVTAAGHEKWIELGSFQWGVGRGISTATGGSEDRESSAPSVSEIVVTKQQDIATIKLLTEALQGEGKKATIDFVKTDKGQLVVYLSYETEQTMISGYSTSSGGDNPSESLSLNFTKVTVKVTPRNPDGSEGSPETVIYDLGKATVG